MEIVVSLSDLHKQSFQGFKLSANHLVNLFLDTLFPELAELLLTIYLGISLQNLCILYRSLSYSIAYIVLLLLNINKIDISTVKYVPRIICLRHGWSAVFCKYSWTHDIQTVKISYGFNTFFVNVCWQIAVRNMILRPIYLGDWNLIIKYKYYACLD